MIDHIRHVLAHITRILATEYKYRRPKHLVVQMDNSPENKVFFCESPIYLNSKELHLANYLSLYSTLAEQRNLLFYEFACGGWDLRRNNVKFFDSWTHTFFY
jgi:hypothetical protein